MERDGDLGNYLKFNFENAIEIIDKLTKDNNALLDKIDDLEVKLEQARLPEPIEPDTATTRYNNVSREADKAMKRFTAKIKKEIDKNAKSKQSQGQPV